MVPEDPAEAFVQDLSEASEPFLWVTGRAVASAPSGGDLLRVTTVRGGVGTADPRRLPDLRTAATTFFDERGPGVVLLDCLGALVLHCGVERVLRFIEDLHEEIAVRNANLVVFVDPRAMNPRMVAWLARELDPLPQIRVSAGVEGRVVA